MMKMISYKNKYKRIAGSFALLLITSFILGGCESNDLPDRGFELVWFDEFDGNAGDPPSPSNWNFEIGTGENGWGNQELQYYTDREENIAQDGNGNLVITARQESFQGSAYTSARITTKGLRQFSYGRMEARIKTPFSQGLWPAFWMLGSDIDTNPWPGAGEIDIMEMRGQNPRIIAGTLHGPGYSGGDSVTGEFELLEDEGRFDTEFHVFAVEWGPNFVDFFVDNRLYQTLTPEDLPDDTEWVFNDKPFFLLLNVAVGGSFVGSPSATNSRFPQTMTVDYVRVYQ